MTSSSVHEIAEAAGMTSADILRELSAMGSQATSASSSVPPDVAEALLARLAATDASSSATASKHALAADAGLVALVLRAYEQARTAKPDGWRTMTVPVLKNRLLQLTARGFNEQSYGYGSMRELVASLPDLLDVDAEARPATVTLVDDVSVSSTATSIARPAARVRPDLWNATMDFSAGHQWAWTGSTAVPEDEAPAGSPLLPTVTPDDVARWRDEFAATHADDENRADLRAWATSSGATRQLPPALRPLWNAQLKARAMSRLAQWFHGQNLPMPEDAASKGRDSDHNREQAGGKPAHVGSLRAFVAGCVALMTDEELASLVLPAAAAHRFAERRA